MRKSKISMEEKLSKLFEAKWIGVIAVSCPIVAALLTPFVLEFAPGINQFAWLLLAPALGVTLPLGAFGAMSLAKGKQLARELCGRPVLNGTMLISVPLLSLYLVSCFTFIDFAEPSVASLTAACVGATLTLAIFVWLGTRVGVYFLE